MPKKCCDLSGCRLKLDLVAQSIVCKCGKSFCGSHRGAEQHACSFDFQAIAKDQLLKYMSSPVVAKKVEVI